MAEDQGVNPAPVGGSSLDDQIKGYLSQVNASTAQTEKRIQSRDAARADAMKGFLKTRDDSPPPDAPKLDPPPQMHETQPLQAFGSMASALAVFGSLLTRRPLISALNSSAAAMNAIRQNDAATYQREYQSWEKQSDYAFKTAAYQNERYRSIIENKKLNFEELSAYLTAEAAANHDDLLLQQIKTGNLHAGIEMIYKRQELGLRAQEARDRIPPESKALNAYIDEYKKSNGGAYPPAQDMQKFIMGFQKKLTPQEIAMQAFREQHPNATAEQMRDFSNSLQQRGVSGGLGMINTMKAAAIKKAFDEWRAAHPDQEMDAKTQTEIIGDATRPQLTGNARDRLASDVDLIGFNMHGIDEAADILDRNILTAGLGGRAGRMAEVVGNVLAGDNSTDRKQFERTINYLKLNAPHILSQRQGRPMSQEEGKIDNIIAGLSLGDTFANTTRALKELKELYGTERERMIQRWNGTWTPQDLSAPVAPAAPAAKAPGAPAPAAGASPARKPWDDD